MKQVQTDYCSKNLFQVTKEEQETFHAYSVYVTGSFIHIVNYYGIIGIKK